MNCAGSFFHREDMGANGGTVRHLGTPWVLTNSGVKMHWWQGTRLSSESCTRVTICDCNSSHVVNCKKGFITSFYCICGSRWLNNRWETQPRFLISTSSLMEQVKAEGVTSWPVSRAESIIRVGTPLTFCAWLVHSFLSDHRRWCLLLRGWSQNPGKCSREPMVYKKLVSEGCQIKCRIPS